MYKKKFSKAKKKVYILDFTLQRLKVYIIFPALS